MFDPASDPTSPQALRFALEHAFARQMALIDSLEPGQLHPPYHPGINPPVWEGGHAAFFYEVFLLRPWLGRTPLMPGLDPVWDSFDIDHEDRWVPGVVPDWGPTRAYMIQVRDTLLDCLATRPLTPQDRYLYRYGIAHQHMHVESMIWARQTLGYPPPPSMDMDAPAPAAESLPAGDATVPAGRYAIGMAIPRAAQDQADEDFAFDCEKPGRVVTLPAFQIARQLVSNGAFLEFVEDGGYRNPHWWSWGGRKWLQDRAPKDPDLTRAAGPASPQGPLYWRQEGTTWLERRFDRWLPLDPGAPVMHMSYWEAEAYCAWAGRRLPTEFEWEAAATGRRVDAPRRRYPWGDAMEVSRVDMDASRFTRPPVTALAAGDSPFGCRQMLGSTWEWTASQFLPYPGFVHDMYPYMSTLQFGYHKVAKGGSWATASRLIRASYRQAYLPERRDVFVGFRTCPLE